ncbi:hypothetical protein L1987_46279 [Smallanthus sonchifolius]|uniref:Uncharacterized protein n=1 Tax=Smallanthus sonchifolius TaxID=185202 RepID=A0ACB9FZC5_9ASTR|nr:hypothetical protein L1987_46279 [Smallanthus sonchifolius]
MPSQAQAGVKRDHGNSVDVRRIFTIGRPFEAYMRWSDVYGPEYVDYILYADHDVLFKIVLLQKVSMSKELHIVVADGSIAVATT